MLTEIKSQVVIGLEVHVQLATAGKAFCGCANRYGEPPNTLTCPICLGYPGTMPMFNRRALMLTARLAMALGCTIHPHSVFSRKNYFYPDLPKGFQISQYDLPLATDGELIYEDDDGQELLCGIERVHLEEDTAKLIHAEGDGADSLLDFNRAGVPLVEVVGRPEITTPRAARRYLEELKRVIESTGASDCDMEKGSLRVDVNVSLRNADGSFGTKIEVKNLNSFRSVERALAHEVARQDELIAGGAKLQRETRLWDEREGTTLLMRIKEGADDYRYFPEPDLPAIAVDDAFLTQISAELLEGPWCGFDQLPLARERWCREHKIPPDDARIYASEPELYRVLRRAWELRLNVDVSTQLIQYIRPISLKNLIDDKPVYPPPAWIAAFAAGIAEKRIMGGTGGCSSFWNAWIDRHMEVVEDASVVTEIAAELGLIIEKVDEEALAQFIRTAIAENPKAVEMVRAGKENAVGPIMGAVMKALGGKADAAEIRRKILTMIRELTP